VDSNGVNTAPSISNIVPSVGVEGYRRNGIGYLKSSPNGEKNSYCPQSKWRSRRRE